MRLDHYSPEKLKREIIETLSRHIDLGSHRVFFFGSRVSGAGDDRSDIDVGIEGPGPRPPSALSSILEDIEEIPVLYKIDIVDFWQVSQDFRDIAVQFAESLN